MRQRIREFCPFSRVLKIILIMCLPISLYNHALREEKQYAALVKRIKTVQSKTTAMTPTQENALIYENGFIYSMANYTKHFRLTDPEFNISVDAWALFRKVEVCVPDSYRDSVVLRPNTPPGIWIDTSNIISVDRPSFMPVKLPEWFSHNFTMDSGFSELNLASGLINQAIQEMDRYIPNKKISLRGVNDISYVGNGYFYWSARGSLTKRLSSSKSRTSVWSWMPLIINLIIFFVFGSYVNVWTYNDDPGVSVEAAVSDLMEDCILNDVRVSHYVFRPSVMSVIAWKDGKNLVNKSIDGHQMAVIRPGIVPQHQMYENIVSPVQESVLIKKCIDISVILIISFIFKRKERMVLWFAIAEGVLLFRGSAWSLDWIYSRAIAGGILMCVLFFVDSWRQGAGQAAR